MPSKKNNGARRGYASLNGLDMAEDTVTLLRQLRIEKADFFGYSMGAAIALQIA